MLPTVMTPESCRSGTERIAVPCGTVRFFEDDIIVNVQGDEPLIAPENIEQVASLLMSNKTADVASLYQLVKSQIELINPHVVKVLVDDHDRALYFSRAEVPYAQDRDAINDYLQLGHYKKHIGMYAYRVAFLEQIVALEPSTLASIESLEQLSWLAYGHTIQMAKVHSHVAMDVNTKDDLEKICQLWDEMAVV